MSKDTKTDLSPVVRSTSYGYVVENYYQNEEGHENCPNINADVLTKNGKPCIFPNLESVPPKWRRYAKAASLVERLNGQMMPLVIQKVEVEDFGTSVPKKFARSM